MKRSTHAYYRQSVESVLEQLESSHEGLTPHQAVERLRHDGPNRLEVTTREPHAIVLFRQFKDPMALLLLASSFLSSYLGDVQVAIVLLLLTLFNVGISFLQEYKAERLLHSLDHLVEPKARVKRSDALQEIDSTELVIGDVVYIEEGTAIPADLRLIETTDLTTNDFALTGESNPSHKFARAIGGDVPLAGRHNLVFMGTTVATGNAYGVVVATGAHTELGRISSLSHATRREDSPLQKEMSHITKRVTQGTLLLGLLVLPFAIVGGLGIKDALLFAIAIAASIIPQGLPAEINTALAQAARKLSASGALIKKLSAVETLGATTLICTDKTGTLTENQMTVTQFMVGRTAYTATGSGYNPDGTLLDKKEEPLTSADLKDLRLFFETGVFASNATISPPDSEHATYYALGDPTEAALITLAEKAGVDTKTLLLSYPELREFSFDSARKVMSSIHRYGEADYLFAKGAPEAILERATDIWDHGHIRQLTPADKTFIKKQLVHLAQDGMRNLAFAYRILPADSDPKHIPLEAAETSLVWLGMVSMHDPLRAEVPAAMQAAHRAHVRVAIITGDTAETAATTIQHAHFTAVGHEPVVVSSEDLQTLPDSNITALLQRGGVIFSRVSPEDKLRIVRLAQRAGQVVAVTGDGINDGPALKQADIGVAMGKTGTDVAKDAAEIVLIDDSFSTLVGAVNQGRTIFQNINKATLAAFTSNAAELFVVLISLAATALFHIPLALSVMQILAIDLIAELLPVSALGNDRADEDVMKNKPRKLSHHILNRASITDLVWSGALIGSLAIANYLLFFDRHGIAPTAVPADTPIHFKAMAITYVTIVLCQLANILMRRSRHGLFTRYQLHNRQLWLAIGFSLAAVLTILYVPFIAEYFKTGPLGLIDWLWAILAMVIFIAIREFQRYDKQHHRKHLHARHRELHFPGLSR